MGTITKNFSYREFEASETADQLDICNVIIDTQVRDAWNRPMHINSGYRCKRLNELVGGTPTSQHTKGEAADIACDEPWELAKLAKDLGLPYDQMILYPTFVHFSHKLNGDQRRAVLYNRRYRGPRL